MSGAADFMNGRWCWNFLIYSSYIYSWKLSKDKTFKVLFCGVWSIIKSMKFKVVYLQKEVGRKEVANHLKFCPSKISSCMVYNKLLLHAKYKYTGEQISKKTLLTVYNLWYHRTWSCHVGCSIRVYRSFECHWKQQLFVTLGSLVDSITRVQQRL